MRIIHAPDVAAAGGMKCNRDKSDCDAETLLLTQAMEHVN